MVMEDWQLLTPALHWVMAVLRSVSLVVARVISACRLDLIWLVASAAMMETDSSADIARVVSAVMELVKDVMDVDCCVMRESMSWSLKGCFGEGSLKWMSRPESRSVPCVVVIDGDTVVRWRNKGQQQNNLSQERIDGVEVAFEQHSDTT